MSELDDITLQYAWSFLVGMGERMCEVHGHELLGISLTKKEGEWYCWLRTRRNGTRWVLFGRGKDIPQAIGGVQWNLRRKKPNWRKDKFNQ